MEDRQGSDGNSGPWGSTQGHDGEGQGRGEYRTMEGEGWVTYWGRDVTDHPLSYPGEVQPGLWGNTI